MKQSLGTFDALCASIRYSGDRARPFSTGSSSSQAGIADTVARIRSTALQVTNKTVPLIHRACGRVADRLLLPVVPEAYIMADPTPNAFAPAWATGERPIVVLHSGLVQLLSATEIEFVIGHELGHLGLRHGEILGIGQRSEFELLQVRSTQRAAEISADRVGLLACRSLHLAARVMIKTASGLPCELLGFDIDAFIRQMERDPAETSREWELDLSHPSLPLRLWSLLRFGHTETYATLSGQGANGLPLGDIDAEIETKLAAIGDGAMSSIEEEMYQKALMWAGLCLVMSDEVIQPHEHTALVALVGSDLADKAVAFAATHGRDVVQGKYNDAKRRLSSAGPELQQRFRSAEEAFRFTLGMDRNEQ